jgi:AraC-like DNA-binding protein
LHRSASCGRVSFHRLQYGGHVRMSAPEMGNFYLFQLALTSPFRIARNQQITDVGDQQAYAVNPNHTFTKDWLPAGDQLIVRIERLALEEHARTLLGPGVTQPIVFHSTVIDGIHDVLVSLAEYVNCVAAAPIRLKRQVQETAISTILATFPNTLSAEIARPARACAPYYVRRVEETIDAGPQAVTSLEDMTQIAGVSLRTLYYGFRRFRDTTPLAYLKAKRLDLAQAKLMVADPSEMTVRSVAVACGFTHLPKFASDFQARFGRSPSSVLKFKKFDS